MDVCQGHRAVRTLHAVDFSLAVGRLLVFWIYRLFASKDFPAQFLHAYIFDWRILSKQLRGIAGRFSSIIAAW